MLSNLFISTLILSFIVQILFFAYAALFKTDKVTDLSYGLTFVILAFFAFLQNQTFYSFQIAALLMVLLWGVRLATYLFIRIMKIKRDKRFDGIREKFWSFASFWFFQAIVVWIVSVPAIYVQSISQVMNWSGLMTVGVLVWLSGMILETFADMQKFNFKNDPANKGKWIASGLWKYARHPNYFGEMMCWWGIFIFAIPFQTGFSWLTIIGPITITIVLRYLTGVPTLEKKYNEMYKDNQEYQKYKKSTNLLIPIPRA